MLDSPTAESDANGNNRPQTQTMVIDMSGSVLRQSCVVISVLLFLAAFMFGLVATEPGRTPTVALVSGGFLVSGSLALFAAAMTKPDK
jgi:hypothetical protein